MYTTILRDLTIVMVTVLVTGLAFHLNLLSLLALIGLLIVQFIEAVRDDKFRYLYVEGALVIAWYAYRLDYMGFAVAAFVLWFIFAVDLLVAGLRHK